MRNNPVKLYKSKYNAKALHYKDNEYFLLPVTAKHISKNILILNPSWYDRHKTAKNSLGSFKVYKECLRSSCVSAQYADIINKPEQKEATYVYYKEIITANNGCLISDHTDFWKKLAIEMVDEGKEVYITNTPWSTKADKIYILFKD